MMRFLMIKYAVSFLLMSMALSVYGQNVDGIFEKVRNHDFNPLVQDNSMTFDKDLNTAGIADLNDKDWKVRMIAVRDLVHEGSKSINEIISGLNDTSIHVRQVTAYALGVISEKVAIEPLEQVLLTDENAMVRSQAVISLGQMESRHSLDLLRKKLQEDPSRDVRHQCELAIDQIEKQKGTTEKLQKAFLSIDKSTFETVDENTVAPDFILEDTEGIEWQLSDFRNKKWVVLIWVFADWCPVCHGEFHDLMKMQDQFEEAGIQIEIEIHPIGATHPNTYKITLKNNSETREVIAISTGGGMIELIEIDGAPVSMAGDFYQTLVYCKSPANLITHIQQSFDCDEIALREGTSSFIEIKSDQFIPTSLEASLLEMNEVLFIKKM